MNTLHILAFDPGPRWMGWARLDAAHGPGCRMTYRTGGQVLAERIPFRRLLQENIGGFPRENTLVVIEAPAGHVFDKARGAPLMATSAVAGGMLWVAADQAYPVIGITAQQVRKVLAGKANANDDLVRDVVTGNVFLAPQHHDSHVHDAIAAGLLGAWLHLGIAALPRPVAKPRRPRKTSIKGTVSS